MLESLILVGFLFTLYKLVDKKNKLIYITIYYFLFKGEIYLIVKWII
ncbi:hypothetical protein AS86_5716 (plasmid) [Bacillus thuringiensis HD1002]|uniref:Uncharacterized protein n=1 Tax=Bacillus thuringiensis subsp. israelensis TaxID=1430 RepID=A0AAX3HYB0_BACTI|nr:hypothetical protein AS86_5716 [Bacillus thuringiensis HD1002]RCX34926.1 hypothetical protein DEU45_1372 [Bacillus sp. AG102]TWE59210.1 hypothetical protein FHW38_12626 [Bacillus thuringiensis]TWG35409.1 hypothetical protein FHX98_5850 [Bacillus sp. AK8]VIJ07887.1 hypothetical protein BTAR23_AR23_05984 [Bacillus thuringiensis serovar israelensis]